MRGKTSEIETSEYTGADEPGGSMTIPGTDQAVQITGLTRTYRTGGTVVRALDEVSIAFPVGAFTAIMGPSGSGKSTLLQCAAGLDRPDSGRVTVGGTDLTGLDETALTLLRRDHIGFVFQSFNLLPSLTATQNIELPLRLAGIRPDRARVAQALAAVGLAERAGHRPAQLSGGQQQRVAIARALVARPAVLFADEPTGALDATTGRELLVTLRGLLQAADGGLQSIVMVTHDPVVAAHADRVVFLADGRVVGELPNPTAAQVAARMTGLEADRC
ncbi:ABC transporter ATP-binding protein [Kineosporia rhizophila]|nr:ABC transporter ATP-binding protein [Kineosporia rhizophila]MCE0537652.1 ABC transporter ATP-binding protein [Kineosporia rhizophila]